MSLMMLWRRLRRGDTHKLCSRWGVSRQLTAVPLRVSACCAGHLQHWSWLLSKSATFGWLFNARAESFEQNTVHSSAQRSRRFTGVRVRWDVRWLKSTRGGVGVEITVDIFIQTVRQAQPLGLQSQKIVVLILSQSCPNK